MTIPKSLLIPFQLRPLTGNNYHLLLILSAPIHLLGRDCLETYQAHISFSAHTSTRYVPLTRNPNPGSSVIEAKPFLTRDPISRVALPQIPIYSTSLINYIRTVLQVLPKSLWAQSNPDVGPVHSEPPSTTQVDPQNSSSIYLYIKA